MKAQRKKSKEFLEEKIEEFGNLCQGVVTEMNAQEIERLKMYGKTSYENCQKLAILENALNCMSKPGKSWAAHEEGTHSMTKQDAESWVSRMKNADGSVGAHWPMDKTEQVRTQRGITCDPVKFWVAMNMMYSDYCEVAKKNNASTVDFFADMAKAFLDDADAEPDKLARYHKYVVRH